MHDYIIPNVQIFNGIGFSRELTKIIPDLEPNSMLFESPNILRIKHPFANAGDDPKPGIQNLLDLHAGATVDNMSVSELPYFGLPVTEDSLPNDRFTII